MNFKKLLDFGKLSNTLVSTKASWLSYRHCCCYFFPLLPDFMLLLIMSNLLIRTKFKIRKYFYTIFIPLFQPVPGNDNSERKLVIIIKTKTHARPNNNSSKLILGEVSSPSTNNMTRGMVTWKKINDINEEIISSGTNLERNLDTSLRGTHGEHAANTRKVMGWTLVGKS